MAKEKLRVHRANRIKLTLGDKVYQIVICTVVGLITVMCLFPLLYVIGMSMTSEGELLQRNYFVIIPWHPTILAYTQILRTPDFFNSVYISFARAVLGCAASLVMTVPGGYIMAKHDLPCRKIIMMFFIITMLIGGGLIPDYLLRKDLGLLDTFWVYIIPSFGGTFNMLIIKIFVENIPSDIIESADLDGATELQKLRHIAIPLLVPTLCALGLFAVVGHWNEWFSAMVYVKDQKLFPVQFVIRNLMVKTTTPDYSNQMPMQRVTNDNVKFASVVIAVIPVLVVYPFLQKYFIYGVYTGSVKG